MKAATLLCAVLLCFALRQAHAQTVEVSQKAIKAVVEDWNNAHNTKNTFKLEELYASKLLFYGQRLSEGKCLRKKTTLFNTYPDFQQKVISPALNLTAYSSGKIKCDFTKEVTFNGQTKQYPCYLLLEKDADGYHIVGESDYITDRNLNYQAKLGKQVGILNTEDEAITSATDDNASGLSMLLKVACLVVVFYILRKLWAMKVWNLVGDRRKYYRELRTHASDPPRTRSSRYQHEQRTRTVFAGTSTIRTSVGDGILTYDEIGRQFEEYTVLKFDRQYFKLIDWRSDKIINGIYPESNQYPDLQFEVRVGRYINQFAVECKFRSRFTDDQIEISRESQLKRYRAFQTEREIPVYIFIGIGGTPKSPEESFLIPLDRLLYPVAKRGYLEGFRKDIREKFFFNREDHSLT
jgi:hypothetical protein